MDVTDIIQNVEECFGSIGKISALLNNKGKSFKCYIK